MKKINAAITLLALSQCAAAQSTLILKRAWINKYANRATISGQFFVDHALHSAKTPSPSQPANDGDIHAAGRSPQVGLPMVAEVMNAADDNSSPVKLVDAQEGKNKSVAVTGVWRLWFEHPPSGQTQTQDFTKLAVPSSTNPDHCFEIHPIVNFNGTVLADTFHGIPGFKAKDATEAFTHYEKLRLSLRANTTAATLSSNEIGYNYVKFKLRLNGPVTPLKANDDNSSDGFQAIIDALAADAGDDDAALAKGVRAIFVANTPPAQAVSSLGAGDELLVLGIPRVDLNRVNSYLKAGGTTATSRKLPYEMVIVAVLPQ